MCYLYILRQFLTYFKPSIHFLTSSNSGVNTAGNNNIPCIYNQSNELKVHTVLSPAPTSSSPLSQMGMVRNELVSLGSCSTRRLTSYIHNALQTHALHDGTPNRKSYFYTAEKGVCVCVVRVFGMWCKYMDIWTFDLIG